MTTNHAGLEHLDAPRSGVASPRRYSAARRAEEDETEGFDVAHLLEYLEADSKCRLRFLAANGWVSRDASSLAADVRRAMVCLSEHGVRGGMRVGLSGPNSYGWIVCDLALIALRAVSVAMVEGSEHTLHELVQRYGLVRAVLLEEPTVAPGVGQLLVPPGSAELCGAALHGFDSPRAAAPAEDSFEEPFLIFSSGSTGRQKCLRISRRGAAHLVESFNRVYGCRADDSVLVFLPLSNLQQRLIVYGAIWLGIEIVLVTPHALFRALKESSPTVIVAPPLFYETIQGRFLALPWLARVAVSALTTVARLLPGELPGFALRRLYAPIHDGLGGKVRLMITGMAHTRKSTLRFFERAGFPLYEAYGLTECGLVAGNPPGHARLGSVGKPFDVGSVSIGADSEIVVTRRHLLSLGYVEDADEAEVFVGSHVVRTGDLGHFDADGYLYIDGRKKELIVTAGGYKVHPETLELAVLECPEVECCAVLASEGNRGLYAVVALRQGLGPAGAERVREHVSVCNRRLAVGSRIVHVEVAARPFSVEDGTRTRNLKLNRREIARRYPLAGG